MARFRRMEVLNRMEETGLVPVFYNKDAETAMGIATACAEGGAACLEFTNRGDGAVEVFRAVETFCRQNHPRLILGIGSIVDAPTAALYIAHGANFIVGPVLDQPTALLCNQRKIPYCPGCGSVTEIQQAHGLGVEICKVFPAEEVGGPGFVKALRGPCPWASILPTGGIAATRESLSEWFGAGITCAGMGSNLITRELVEKRDFKGLAERIKATLSLIREIRGEIAKAKP